MGNGAGQWEGMSSGAVDENFNGRDALEGGAFSALTGFTGNETYKTMLAWDRMPSAVKITPMFKKQQFTISSVAYIEKGVPDPQVQRFPISDVKVTPHQISFDFFDTSEGKIGVSNATEKHMQVEFDVYVTELIYYRWDHAGNYANSGSGWTDWTNRGHYGGFRNEQQQREALNKYMQTMQNKEVGDTNVISDDALKMDKKQGGIFNWIANGAKSAIGRNQYVNNFEETQNFIDFRNFLFYPYNGWVCNFTSQTFGSFDGVITECTFDIESGFSDAKYHLKVEEAIFTDDYSEDGVKKTTSEEGSQETPAE